MTKYFAKSSILITGASRGIGREIAIVFAKETQRPLILVARSNEGLAHTKVLCQKEGANKIAVISCDLTQRESVENIELHEDFESPGIIINNAGSYLLKPLQQTDYKELMKQIKDNLFSAVHVTNRFLDNMRKLDRGLIINICSAGALEGLADSGAYASAKHALLGYTRSLRKELMESEVGVTALNLGQTQSTSWEGSDVDPQRLIDPKDVARLLVSLTKLSTRSLVEEIIMNPQHGRVPPM